MLNRGPTVIIQSPISFAIKPVYAFLIKLSLWIPRPRLHLTFEVLESRVDIDSGQVSVIS
jgi:hypothetical protein